jgi:1-deoxy-D-xylulose-5-phosphate reductoisomerase
MQKSISILGVTGSIGQSTLDIIAQHPDKFSLSAVTAHENIDGLIAVCKKFMPRYAAIASPALQATLREALAGTVTQAIDGNDAIIKAAAIPCDISVAAMMGAVGVAPILKALESGAHVALANKEALVCAGPQVLATAAKHQRMLLPLDSEHNAAFQCWNAHTQTSLASLTLTASGGPFLTRDLNSFSSITPEEAVKHPRWNMGAKISVDSATMMNKGLELIEAHYLFNLAHETLQAVIHPQSIVHALLTHHDGSVLAQMAMPDMRIPIAYALSWPERLPLKAPTLNIAELSRLDFYPIEKNRYPLYFLACEALKHGQAAMITLNASNEVAVQAFLQKAIGFTEIHAIVERTLNMRDFPSISSVEDALAWDVEARSAAHHFTEQRA